MNNKNRYIETHTGYSRRVFLIGKHAVKFARDINGRRCNLGESFLSASASKSDNIARVKSVWWNGWIIVMERCNHRTHEREDLNEINRSLLSAELQKQGITS